MGQRRILTPDREGEFERDWMNGMVCTEMAKKYGYGAPNSIIHVVQRMGLPPRKGEHSVNYDRFKADWADETITTREVADRHGFKDQGTPRRVAKRLGLPNRKQGVKPSTARSASHRDTYPSDTGEDLAQPEGLRPVGRWIRGRGGIKKWVTE